MPLSLDGLDFRKRSGRRSAVDCVWAGAGSKFVREKTSHRRCAKKAAQGIQRGKCEGSWHEPSPPIATNSAQATKPTLYKQIRLDIERRHSDRLNGPPVKPHPVSSKRAHGALRLLAYDGQQGRCRNWPQADLIERATGRAGTFVCRPQIPFSPVLKIADIRAEISAPSAALMGYELLQCARAS